jgi:hypothetical protein
MSERWESDSLRWIHELREENYRRAKGTPLGKLPLGPSREAKALSRRLDLQRGSLGLEQLVEPARRKAVTSDE